MKRAFAINLKAGRQHKGWSMKEAARRYEIPYRNLESYEADRAKPKHHVLVRICELLGVDDMPRFLTDRDYYGQGNIEVPISLIEKKYRSLEGPAKKAVDVLLGLD